MTLVVVSYDRRAGTLVLANAGHSPVYLSCAGAPLRRLEPTAPPLGVGSTTDAEDQRFNFREDDLLVLASDGFSEARDSSGKQLGVERLAQILDRTRSASARGIIEHLVHVVSDFAADSQVHDDQTALILKGGPGR